MQIPVWVRGRSGMRWKVGKQMEKAERSGRKRQSMHREGEPLNKGFTGLDEGRMV